MVECSDICNNSQCIHLREILIVIYSYIAVGHDD